MASVRCSFSVVHDENMLVAKRGIKLGMLQV